MSSSKTSQNVHWQGDWVNHCRELRARDELVGEDRKALAVVHFAQLFVRQRIVVGVKRLQVDVRIDEVQRDLALDLLALLAARHWRERAERNKALVDALAAKRDAIGAQSRLGGIGDLQRRRNLGVQRSLEQKSVLESQTEGALQRARLRIGAARTSAPSRPTRALARQ